jgi:hypothetical protein
VCWKPCSSCWSFHLLREEFLSAPIHSPPLWFAVSVLHHEIQLALLHLKTWLLVVVAISGSGVLVLLLGLLLPGVWALICIMPGLSTIVAYAGWKFFRLGHFLLILLVLKIYRRLILE